ncbi:cytochrome P450 [Aspergillus undulatus]|uniref:cytochrome P450 n=1 Tax=Aspergillus undulatus TaxID=1810928 RepID=UPI003CCDA32E
MAAPEVQSTSCPVSESQDINTSALVTSNETEKIYREHDYLRSHCPVPHVDKHDGYWVLTRYKDIKEDSPNNQKYISYICTVPYRTAIDRTLKHARLKRLEPIIRTHCQRELDVLIDRGHGDMYEEFGSDWTSWIGREWLNLDAEDGELLVEWFAKWSDEWYGIARKVARARKEKLLDPEVNPASSLLLERDKNRRGLEEEHIIGCIQQIVIIAMVAPTIMVTAITKHLAEDKSLQTKLRHDRSLLPSAIEEFIRLHVPYRGFSRTAVQEEISGTRFPELAKFILDRENISLHLGFGRGIHRIYLETILDRCRDWDVEGEIVCPIRFYKAK